VASPDGAYATIAVVDGAEPASSAKARRHHAEDVASGGVGAVVVQHRRGEGVSSRDLLFPQEDALSRFGHLTVWSLAVASASWAFAAFSVGSLWPPYTFGNAAGR
jgi:hypothetical protein